jgi:hypothetical protein
MTRNHMRSKRVKLAGEDVENSWMRMNFRSEGLVAAA